MSRALRLLRRASQAGPRELWVRSRQLMFAVRNYSGSLGGGSALSRHGHLRSLGIESKQLGEWWRDRRTQWFVDAPRVAVWQSQQHEAASGIPWIMERADDVLDNRLPLFSYGTVDYTMPRRWHHDVIRDKTAPHEFHGRVAYLDCDVVGDSKHVWEPNRFAWAIWLGMAYRISGESRYAEKFREWTTDWFRSNPYPIGINYCSALELAYRNYAWLWSLSLFADYLAGDEELLNQLLNGIWTASRHVEENLSLYFAPNTHVLGEAFGLYAVGSAIPEFADAPRWRTTGLQLLETESQKQFYQDGMHKELSSGYHIYSADLYLQAVMIGRESGFQVPSRVEATARRAARRLAELVPCDLTMPQFNDCDGGRVTQLVPRPLDAGPTLLAAEDLFADEAFLPEKISRRGYPQLMGSVASAPEAPDVLRRRWNAVPIDRDMHEIYDSGLASYRTAVGDYVLLRGSEFGYLDCPHSHDAGLGIILHLQGQPIFVDSGVGSYTQSEACRNAFRSASGKNTVLVHGSGPSQPDGWFSWKSTTDSQLVSMRRFYDGFIARAKHAGFSDPPGQHTFVQREIIMLEIGVIAIVDRWDSNLKIPVESRFTLSPDLEVDSARKVLRSPEQEEFHFDSVSLIVGEVPEFVNNTQDYSADYGLLSKTKAITFKHPSCNRGGMVTFVSRCGPLRRNSDGVVSFENTNVTFDLTPSGVLLRSTRSIEQLN